MKTKRPTALLSGLLLIAAQPISALANPHGRPAPGTHGSGGHTMTRPGSHAPSHPASSPSHPSQPAGGAPHMSRPAPGAHHSQPTHSGQPPHHSQPGTGFTAPSNGHPSSHPSFNQPRPGRPSPGFSHEGRRPHSGNGMHGRPVPSGAFGGHAMGYMPPHHRRYANSGWRAGYRTPISGYPGWYWYSGYLIYRNDAGFYYDELGNEVTMGDQIQEGVSVEAYDGCCNIL